jgi:hypothetical protein
MINPYPDFPGKQIFNISSHPGSGYQGFMTIAWVPGMRYDFRDLRFHDDVGRKIPYWVQSKTDGSTATIIVKLTSSKIVVCRYGNGAAVSESNIDNTAEFGDEFNGTSINANKWTNAPTSVSNGICDLTATTGDKTIYSKTSFGRGYELICRSSGTVQNAATVIAIGFGDSSQDASLSSAIYGGWTNINLTSYSGGNSVATSVAKTPVAYHTHRLYYESTSQLKVDTANAVTLSSNIPNTALPIYLQVLDNIGVLDVDYVFVRKFNGTEPVFTLVSSGYDTPVLNIASILSAEQELLTKNFTSNNDIQLSKNFESQNDLFFDNLYESENDIGLIKFFSGSNDIFIQKSFSSENDIGLIKLFSGSNDIIIQKSFSGSNNIGLIKLFSGSNDIIIQKSFSSENDIGLTKLFSGSNDIIIQKSFSGLNDIQLIKLFINQNDVELIKQFSSTNSILGSITKTFSSSNDIILNKQFSNVNDISVKIIFNSSNDIFILKEIDSLNDIRLTNRYSSSNDIRLYKLFSSENDITCIISKIFTSTNDICLNHIFASNNDVKLNKTFSSSNNIIIASILLVHPLTVVITPVSRTIIFEPMTRTIIIS